MYFTLSQEQYLLWALFGGLAIILILALGYFSYRMVFRPPLGEEEYDSTEHEFPDGIREGNSGVPLFIILLALAILVWGILYTLAIGMGLIGGVYALPA